MKTRVLVLGAGFGGLELCTTLSEALGDQVEVTLIDKADAFVFGFSKLDVMFGHASLDAVRLPYREFVKPGVRFLQETVTQIDPEARRVTTDRGVYEADVLVVALGADYDCAATPGVVEGDNEFYSVAGAQRQRHVLQRFEQGRVVIGVCGAPYKCPAGPSECALMLHHYLTERGVREQCSITLVVPFATPVPPSPDSSRALVAAFAERDITLIVQRRVTSVDRARSIAVLDDGSELPYALFLGVPKHRPPRVVDVCGLAQDGFVQVNPKTLETRFPGVYACGDMASTGTPKAGVFAEGAARAVASAIIARVKSGEVREYAGKGACYVDFGGGHIARVDVDFSGPTPTGTFQEPSATLIAEKQHFGSSRRARWFGRP